MSNLVVNIENVDFNNSNIIFVDGLTLEKVKMKYHWLLNAKIKDAIIGENDYGLVWYFGEWLCGEWIDGTWYSGNFHQGNWNNGKWYSYKLNKVDIISGNFNIVESGPQFSHFLNGIWLNGIWNDGTFGNINITENWNDYILFYYDNTDYLDLKNVPNFYLSSNTNIIKKLSTWLNGKFNQGVFCNAIWKNGIFNDGEIKNSMWIDGKFYFGIFNGNTWFNGNWFNGEFINGKWMNGIFTQLKKDKISRFGSNTNDVMNIVCEWFNGEWKDGEWFSGIKETNNIYYSINNKMSIWYNGTWRNGIWYGGHFKDGTWKNGTWKNGIFGNVKNTEWTEPNNVYEYIESDLTDLGTYWKNQSMQITTASTQNNSELEQEYIQINYKTNLGGWESGGTYFSGVTYNGSGSNDSITLYIRDNYTLYEYNSTPDENKHSNFTYELSQNNILEIGGTGFTVTSVTYSNEIIKYNFSSDPLTPYGFLTTGYTKVVIHEYWSGLDALLSTYNDVNIYVKEKVNYISDNGSERSYFNFNKIIKNNFSKIVFEIESGITPAYQYLPDTLTDISGYTTVQPYRNIYIDIDSLDTNLQYLNGVHKIKSYYISSGKYYLVTDTDIDETINISGKILDYVTFQKRCVDSIPKNVIFENFNINLNYANISTLAGIQIKYNIDINNETSSGNIKDYDIILPFKNLKFKEVNNIPQLVYNLYDVPNYDNYYLGSYDNYEIIGKKIINNIIDNNEYVYGTFTDKWQLEDLIYYYPINNITIPSPTGFNPDDYDVKNIESVINNIRISKSFVFNKTINKSFKLKNISMRLYYYTYNRPVWYNGDFEKGLWIQGELKNGNIYSGMISDGDFNNGYLGYEKNENRKL